MTDNYPRDLIGYAGRPPHANWPGQARVALQFVLNYEEGAENSVLHGDAASEVFLSEIVGAAAFEGRRHLSMESIYEYGSRAGVWRLLDLFRSRQIPLTVFGVGMAMQRHPAVIEQCLKDGHEIASHAHRWINFDNMPIDQERALMDAAVEAHEQIVGEKPKGWYTGRTSENTRNLVAERDHIVYDADDYSDDLPFWSTQVERPHLVVPYTLDTNDMRFATVQGFHTSEQFFTYLKDAFDVLYAEGEHSPKMLSIGMHCRLLGRPARFKAIQQFVDYAMGHSDVWFARRIDIAEHWIKEHPHGR